MLSFQEKQRQERQCFWGEFWERWKVLVSRDLLIPKNGRTKCADFRMNTSWFHFSECPSKISVNLDFSREQTWTSEALSFLPRIFHDYFKRSRSQKNHHTRRIPFARPCQKNKFQKNHHTHHIPIVTMPANILSRKLKISIWKIPKVCYTYIRAAERNFIWEELLQSLIKRAG